MQWVNEPEQEKTDIPVGAVSELCNRRLEDEGLGNREEFTTFVGFSQICEMTSRFLRRRQRARVNILFPLTWGASLP